MHETAAGGEGGAGAGSVVFAGSSSTISTRSTGVGGGATQGASSQGGASTASPSGLPCDVSAYLATKCIACHGDPPIPSALAGLVTYSDLQAKAKEDPTKTEAELSLARMQDAKQPMPPGALPSAADVAIIKNWANAGYPMGTCGASTSGAGGASATTAGGGAAGAGASGTVSSASGLPCDLATYLSMKCGACHGDPPIPSALAGLMTYSDLQAKAKEDPTKNEAELSLARMQNTTMPMPPGALPSAADVALLKNWIDAGYPKGTCASGAGGASSAGGSPGQATGGSGSGSGGTSSGAGSDVPCDVATYLAANCTSCHGDPPIPSALSGLVTYADLMATAKEDATKNEAVLSVSRMRNASSPMPPGKLPSAADVAILQNWINAGYPKGACTSPDGGVAPPPPPPPPPTVVFKNAPPYSAQTGPRAHNAGKDCMSCHQNGGGEAPRFSMGGTVYDGSGKAVSGAEVRLLDANGKATSVYTGSTGTFYLQGSGFAAPAHVGVRNATASEEMLTALQAANGGCSSCHCSGASSCTVSVIHLP